MRRWQAKRLGDVDYRIRGTAPESRWEAAQGHDREIPRVVASPADVWHHRGALCRRPLAPVAVILEIINARCAERQFYVCKRSEPSLFFQRLPPSSTPRKNKEGRQYLDTIVRGELVGDATSRRRRWWDRRHETAPGAACNWRRFSTAWTTPWSGSRIARAAIAGSTGPFSSTTPWIAGRVSRARNLTS